MSAWRIALLMGLLALVPTPARAAEQHVEVDDRGYIYLPRTKP